MRVPELGTTAWSLFGSFQFQATHFLYPCQCSKLFDFSDFSAVHRLHVTVVPRWSPGCGELVRRWVGVLKTGSAAVEVLWAQRSSHLRQFDQFYRCQICQSMSQVVSLQPWEFIASQSPGIAFPDQVASEPEGGVLLQGLGYLEASIKALSIIVDHNFSG